MEAKDLEATLRMEYRSKLLNPKWAQAMAAQGSGGAYEISQRMTAMVGWAGTAEFREQWVFDGAAETYALDPEMAKKLAGACVSYRSCCLLSFWGGVCMYVRTYACMETPTLTKTHTKTHTPNTNRFQSRSV